MTQNAFAVRIGTANQQLSAWLRKGWMRDLEYACRIEEQTGGAVQACEWRRPQVSGGEARATAAGAGGKARAARGGAAATERRG